MEIRNHKKSLDFKLKSSYLTGIYTDNFSSLKKINIIIDNKNLNSYQGHISYIKKLDKDTFLTRTVSDEFYLRLKETDNTSYLSKMIAVLEMLGLDKEYLKREITSLSKSEKRLIEFALSLINDPEVLIIEEPYLYLGKKDIMHLQKVILNLKRKYQKTVIIISSDIDTIYALTDYVFILKNDQILTSGKTLSLLSDTDYLEKNGLPQAEIIKVQKEISHDKLRIYQNIDDLVKGVYDNVKKNT